MCPINVAKWKESSSKLERERKENAGVRERFILANAPDAADDYRVRRVRCSIAGAERVGAWQEFHVLLSVLLMSWIAQLISACWL